METVGHIRPEGIQALAAYFIRMAERGELDIFEDDGPRSELRATVPVVTVVGVSIEKQEDPNLNSHLAQGCCVEVSPSGHRG